MGLPQKDGPNVGPPAPTHAGQALPLQHPQDEVPQQYPPACVSYAAEPSSPCPFPPQQHHPLYQQPQTAAFHPPPQPAVPFPPEPQQCYPSPATYPPSGPQQFNQAPTPVQGVGCQNPYVPKPATYPPSGPQQFNQPPTPVQGVACQYPYVPKPTTYPPSGPQQFHRTPTPVQGVGCQNPYVPNPQYSANWTTGLFDCLDDPNSALITFCFPCVTFGQVAEILDNGQTSCTTSAMMYSLMAFAFGVPWILSCTYRTKLRTMYGLPESPAPDLIVHCFCDWCAICQEYRELRNRGLDPALGWHGIMMLQAQQQQATMAPPVNQTMNM